MKYISTFALLYAIGILSLSSCKTEDGAHFGELEDQSSPPKLKIASPRHSNSRVNNQLIKEAYLGNTSEVEKLINKGGNINGKDDDENTALILAAYSGHVNTVKFLVSKGAHINHSNRRGFTALMFAATNNHLHVVEFLLQQEKINIEKEKMNGHTALKMAEEKENHEVARIIQESLAKKELRKDNLHALKSAINTGDYKKAKTIIDNAQQNGLQDKDFHARIGDIIRNSTLRGKGHIDILEALIDQTENLDEKNRAGETVLMSVIQCDFITSNINIVCALIEKTKTFDLKNRDQKTALDLAEHKRRSNQTTEDDTAYEKVIAKLKEKTPQKSTQDVKGTVSKGKNIKKDNPA